MAVITTRPQDHTGRKTDHYRHRPKSAVIDGP